MLKSKGKEHDRISCAEDPEIWLQSRQNDTPLRTSDLESLRRPFKKIPTTKCHQLPKMRLYSQPVICMQQWLPQQVSLSL